MTSVQQSTERSVEFTTARAHEEKYDPRVSTRRRDDEKPSKERKTPSQTTDPFENPDSVGSNWGEDDDQG
jgi:hypothetical protein